MKYEMDTDKRTRQIVATSQLHFLVYHMVRRMEVLLAGTCPDCGDDKRWDYKLHRGVINQIQAESGCGLLYNITLNSEHGNEVIHINLGKEDQVFSTQH